MGRCDNEVQPFAEDRPWLEAAITANPLYGNLYLADLAVSEGSFSISNALTGSRIRVWKSAGEELNALEPPEVSPESSDFCFLGGILVDGK